MDFTVKKYEQLLQAIKASGYATQNMATFMEDPVPRVIVLRHDVDQLPGNALKTAGMEHELGISASYYFRAVPASWNEDIIQKIDALGHEIGYHYESLSACGGDPERAWADFQANLERLRALAPVKTICMHGSPLSRINNLDLWKTYDYKALGIIGEPYLDVDFKEVFYLTDTGRKWNNAGASIRDRVDSGFDIVVRDTFHILELIGQGRLPDKVMINVHPQRWFDFGLSWINELVWQNIKNIAKATLIKTRNV